MLPTVEGEPVFVKPPKPQELKPWERAVRGVVAPMRPQLGYVPRLPTIAVSRTSGEGPHAAAVFTLSGWGGTESP